jgi:hypothetical protein
MSAVRITDFTKTARAISAQCTEILTAADSKVTRMIGPELLRVMVTVVAVEASATVILMEVRRAGTETETGRVRRGALKCGLCLS